MNLADIVPIDHVSLCRAITSEFCKAYDEEMSNIGKFDLFFHLFFFESIILFKYPRASFMLFVSNLQRRSEF